MMEDTLMNTIFQPLDPNLFNQRILEGMLRPSKILKHWKTPETRYAYKDDIVVIYTNNGNEVYSISKDMLKLIPRLYNEVSFDFRDYYNEDSRGVLSQESLSLAYKHKINKGDVEYYGSIQKALNTKKNLHILDINGLVLCSSYTHFYAMKSEDDYMMVSHLPLIEVLIDLFSKGFFGKEDEFYNFSITRNEESFARVNVNLELVEYGESVVFWDKLKIYLIAKDFFYKAKELPIIKNIKSVPSLMKKVKSDFYIEGLHCTRTLDTNPLTSQGLCIFGFKPDTKTKVYIPLELSFEVIPNEVSVFLVGESITGGKILVSDLPFRDGLNIDGYLVSAYLVDSNTSRVSDNPLN